ncbi:MAG: enoyl-ACP reductase FabI [Alphaproteobacteria bacterium]|nr:enoyl-ACP reductase FabI [Alphaproteobacteria bacterium]
MKLNGKRGLIIGIANNLSIAYGCAKVANAAGAELAITYLNEKADPHVRPLAEALSAKIILPCNVEEEGSLERVFETITEQWGKLDFLIHSIAYAPKADLLGRLVDCSSAGFSDAMFVSCYSFIKMAKLALPLMQDNGGSLLCMSYYGAEKAIANYNLMGPVKSALESVTRYLAVELGDYNIRVNALSPGPIHTRAASGLNQFGDLLSQTKAKSPIQMATIEDVGSFAAYLISDEGRAITGSTLHIDSGYHIVG